MTSDRTMTIRQVIDATAYGKSATIRIAHPANGSTLIVSGEGNVNRWNSVDPFTVQTLNKLRPANRLMVGPVARPATKARALTITPDTFVTIL